MKKLVLIFILSMAVLACAAQQLSQRSTSIVTIENQHFYVHTVAQGETLWSISRLYDVPQGDIVRHNPLAEEVLPVGMAVKVPVNRPDERLSQRKRNRMFDTHVVNRGETLYSISRRYEIPVNTLLEDNEGLDPAKISVGQVINIRKKSVGEASAEEIGQQMNDYVEAINQVSEDKTYHLVRQGETIYSLANRYGITQQQLEGANNLSTGLRAGAMIVIPVAGQDMGHQIPSGEDANVEEESQSADSLLWRWPRVVDRGPGYLSLDHIKDFTGRDPLRVSLMLPLSGRDSTGTGRAFLDFYQGVLLALEDVKAEGVSVQLSLYNTAQSEERVADIVRSTEFSMSDIIIGPVYENMLRYVLVSAEQSGSVVVSPLAAVSGYETPLLYQMAPVADTKYEKIRPLLQGDKNVVYIKTDKPDAEMDSLIRDVLPPGYRTFDYSGNIKTTSFNDIYDSKRENVFIVSCVDELRTDQILAGLSSMQNNLLARSLSSADIRVVGGTRWGRFRGSIDKNLFFKLKVCYLSGYHADRSDQLVAAFDKRYVEAFRSVPSLYSYRGYDTAKLFIMSAARSGRNFREMINSGSTPLLQVSYDFDQRIPGGKYVNTQWSLVCYNTNYTITVK